MEGYNLLDPDDWSMVVSTRVEEANDDDDDDEMDDFVALEDIEDALGTNSVENEPTIGFTPHSDVNVPLPTSDIVPQKGKNV